MEGDYPPAYQSSEDVNPSAPKINEAYTPEEDNTGQKGFPENGKENFDSSEEFGVVAKPPSAPILELEPYERPIVVVPPELTEDEIREACLGYAAKHCCYGSRFVKQMVIPQIINNVVLHYSLQSLGEKRETSQKFTPYCGQTIDGPENGAAPDPWEMVIDRPRDFRDSQTNYEVPRTAFVRQCNKCDGRGKITCPSCGGRGRRTCISCGGTGRGSNNRPCSGCGGSGSNCCGTCGGSGRVTCPRCEGHGRLKWFTMLIVKWKNHADNFLTDTAILPRDLILKAHGKTLFNEENVKVLPLCNAPDADVNIASTQLVQTHARGFANELTLKQRHWLRAVPFVTVRYGWKSKVGEFYVYGLEKQVYFEEYPQPCCCCTCL